MTPTYADLLKRLMELEKKRTPGKWMFADDGPKYITTLYSDSGREFGYTANSNHEHQVCDGEYLASMPDAMRLIEHLVADNERLRECLEGVWYSEFSNSETCMEGQQIKQALAATGMDKKVGE